MKRTLLVMVAALMAACKKEIEYGQLHGAKTRL